MTPNKKIPLFIESLMLIGLLFVASNLYFYNKKIFLLSGQIQKGEKYGKNLLIKR